MTVCVRFVSLTPFTGERGPARLRGLPCAGQSWVGSPKSVCGLFLPLWCGSLP